MTVRVDAKTLATAVFAVNKLFSATVLLVWADVAVERVVLAAVTPLLRKATVEIADASVADVAVTVDKLAV